MGRKIGALPEAEGIKTVLQFRRLNEPTVRRRRGIVLERTVRELNGASCLALEDIPPTKKRDAKMHNQA